MKPSRNQSSQVYILLPKNPANVRFAGKMRILHNFERVQLPEANFSGKTLYGGGDILDAAFLFSLYNQMSTVHWGNENEMSQADLAFLLLRLDYFGQYSAKVS